MAEHLQSARRLVPPSAVLEQVPISKASMWRYIADREFPQPVRIGKRRVAFFQDEIDAWLAQRAAERACAKAA